MHMFTFRHEFRLIYMCKNVMSNHADIVCIYFVPMFQKVKFLYAHPELVRLTALVATCNGNKGVTPQAHCKRCSTVSPVLLCSWNVGTRVPTAIQMLGRNCGLYTEDDLLLNSDGDGGVVVGDSCCPAASGSRKPVSRASSLQPSMSR